MNTYVFVRHIKEHLKDLPVDEAKMENLDEKDTLFYLFSMHDYNKDGFLDGHELRAAFTDFEHDEDVSELISLDEVTDMVDHVLEEDDLNGE